VLARAGRIAGSVEAKRACQETASCCSRQRSRAAVSARYRRRGSGWRVGRSFLSASTRTRARGRWASRRPRDRRRAGGSRQPVARRQVIGRAFHAQHMASARTDTPQKGLRIQWPTACSWLHARQAPPEGCWPRGRGQWRPGQDAVDARGGSNTVKRPQRREVTRY
jgi:hypothetical protein